MHNPVSEFNKFINTQLTSLKELLDGQPLVFDEAQSTILLIASDLSPGRRKNYDSETLFQKINSAEKRINTYVEKLHTVYEKKAD